jgi:hypothetical protein
MIAKGERGNAGFSLPTFDVHLKTAAFKRDLL